MLVNSTVNNLRGLALAVAAGKPVCLCGPVGCGKTALVQHLALITGFYEFLLLKLTKKIIICFCKLILFRLLKMKNIFYQDIQQQTVYIRFSSVKKWILNCCLGLINVPMFQENLFGSLVF